MKLAVLAALLGMTGAAETEQPQQEDNVLAELEEGETIDGLCENDYLGLDDESLVELERASYQNHRKIAAVNKKILRTEAICKKWVMTHKRHNVICKWCKKGVKPSTYWKFYRGVWYRYYDGRWHYYGPSKNGYGGRWRWFGGFWHYNGFTYKYVGGKWYRFYNHKWHYYRRMIPINPKPPTTPKYCVRVYQMVKAGIPGALSVRHVPRCQVGRTVYMWGGSRQCKILGGRYVKQRLAKCRSGSAHKWRKVKRCSGGEVYRPMAPRERLNIAWSRIAGSAHDISYGGGKVWVIGTNREAGGYGIYRRDKNRWTKIGGSALRISGDRHGNAWVTNKYANIYYYNGKRWNHHAGKAWDVGTGTNDVTWVIGTNREAGGFGIYKRLKWNRWRKIPGSATRIAVNGRGNAWVVNKYNNIYEHNGRRWYHRPGKAIDVGCYGNSVMVVGTDRRMYRFNHNTKGWARTTGASGNNIAVGKDGQALLTTTNKGIWFQRN